MDQPAGRVRVRLCVAYDGSGFHGFAPNPGVQTVASELTRAIERVVRAPVELTCAGRTDAGVHAWGQVVHVDVPAGVDPGRLARSCNALVGPVVVVRDAALAAPDFDARHDAQSRVYRYSVLNRTVPDPFLRLTTWHVAAPLDLAAMNAAARHLIGEHDFASFCRRRRVVGADGVVAAASTVRRVLAAGWSRVGEDVVRFEIEANAFCHQMVRSIAGTLVDVGRGRRPPESMPAVLAARDRHAAGTVAPPHGLCLWEVRY